MNSCKIFIGVSSRWSRRRRSGRAVGLRHGAHLRTPAAPIALQQWERGRPGGAASDAGPSAATLEWRDFVTDPSLRGLIETALANNRDLRKTLLNVRGGPPCTACSAPTGCRPSARRPAARASTIPPI